MDIFIHTIVVDELDELGERD